MVCMITMTRSLSFIILMSIGYCFCGSTKILFRGEIDTKKYMGYSYKIEKTSDDYCVNSTIPKDGILTPGYGILFDISYKAGAFSYCGWRHSHQWFHVYKYDDPNISADIQWNKPAGKTPHINVEHDPHGIVHVNSEHSVYIGYPR